MRYSGTALLAAAADSLAPRPLPPRLLRFARLLRRYRMSKAVSWVTAWLTKKIGAASDRCVLRYRCGTPTTAAPSSSPPSPTLRAAPAQARRSPDVLCRKLLPVVAATLCSLPMAALGPAPARLSLRCCSLRCRAFLGAAEKVGLPFDPDLFDHLVSHG